MIMGMPVIIDIPASNILAVFDEVSEYLRGIDAKFSAYRSDSEISRYNQGLIKKEALSTDVKFVYDQCCYYSKMTKGYFDACYDETFDPSGYVKAWAIQHAAHIIESHGFHTYLINIAGDMIAHGPDKDWNIAIQDPFQKDTAIGVVTLCNQSIATSGSYERGAHIINPFTKSAATDLVSASVYGEDIIMSDVFATTCIAMGSESAMSFLADHPAYAALLVKKDGSRLVVNDFQLTKMQIAQ